MTMWGTKMKRDRDSNIKRISEGVYHTDDYLKILSDVLEDIVQMTNSLSDSDLDYDRNLFMRQLKVINPSQDTYNEDVHTIAIHVSQLQRFGYLKYNTKKENED